MFGACDPASRPVCLPFPKAEEVGNSEAFSAFGP